MIPTSRLKVVDALRKDKCLQLMEQLGEAQPHRGVLVIEMKAMIKDLLFFSRRKTGKATPRIYKNEQEPAGGQGTSTANTSTREPHDRTLDQDHKGRPCAAVNSGRFRLSGLQQAQSQDVPRSSTGGSRILPLDRPSGGSAIPLETQEVLFVAEDAERLPGTKSGKQHDPGTYDETHRTTRGEKFFEELQASNELDKRRKTPDQKGNRSTTVLEEENLFIEGTSSEVDGTNSVADDAVAGTWSGELRREPCGRGESHGKNTMMSTMSSDEMS